MLKNILKILFSRAFFVGIALSLQVITLVVIILKFNDFFVYFYTLFTLISACVVLAIMNNKSNPAYKLAWIIPIMLFPIFGGLFYLIFGGKRVSSKTRQKLIAITDQVSANLEKEDGILDEIAKQDKNAANQARYLEEYSLCPVYRNSCSKYLASGEEKFARLLIELEKAEQYIFLEYFIVEEGIMWNTILDILVAKVKQGVDVRLIYDDVGSLLTLPYKYNEDLEKLGIKCRKFNPLTPILSLRHNNRDHRKILVIDGKVAFTGGINLADEYINAYEKYGHWKDTAIIIEGKAVWNFTIMFLSLWNYLNPKDEAYKKYKPPAYRKICLQPDGYILPFNDSPMDDEAVSETVYLNLIYKAKDYIYINTPYLIPDNEMIQAICTAAKSGVDVRIVTPHIPDKWYVHAVTRSNYGILLESNVKIYEYTPGFIHAKSIVVDGEFAVIGTINLDYRSLYLHFECGVWMYKTKSVLEIEEDFLETLKICEEMSLEDYKKTAWPVKLGRHILRSFAPLM